MNKIFFMAGVIVTSITLFSCGGSGSSASDTNTLPNTLQEEVIASLSDSSWRRECIPVYEESEIVAYHNNTLTINDSLQSISFVELFNETDTTCNSIVSSVTYTSQLDVLDEVISEESIEAFGLNSTPIDSPDGIEIRLIYTLIYIDGEKLYFGQSSGSNVGDTPETRHSSISLDDYFSKVIN